MAETTFNFTDTAGTYLPAHNSSLMVTTSLNGDGTDPRISASGVSAVPATAYARHWVYHNNSTGTIASYSEVTMKIPNIPTGSGAYYCGPTVRGGASVGGYILALHNNGSTVTADLCKYSEHETTYEVLEESFQTVFPDPNAFVVYRLSVSADANPVLSVQIDGTDHASVHIDSGGGDTAQITTGDPGFFIASEATAPGAEITKFVSSGGAAATPVSKIITYVTGSNYPISGKDLTLLNGTVNYCVLKGADIGTATFEKAGTFVLTIGIGTVALDNTDIAVDGDVLLGVQDPNDLTTVGWYEAVISEQS